MEDIKGIKEKGWGKIMAAAEKVAQAKTANTRSGGTGKLGAAISSRRHIVDADDSSD